MSSATSNAASSTSAVVSSSQSVVVSTSVVSQPTTVTIPPTTTLPGTTITTSVPSTSIVSITPSTTVVVNTPVAPTTIVTQITSIVTQAPTNGGQSTGGFVTTIISTQSTVTITPTASSVSSSRTSANASSTQSALSASGSSGASSGLSSAATIAIGVIVPIVAVIGLVILGLWLWRRRKAKKNDEELRKNEMAEYGFNPNHDPTLPVGAAYTDGGSEGNDDSGYRGWGATTSNRKTSTTLGSQSRGLGGMNGGMSDHGGSQGYAPQPSPSAGGSDVMSQDPLVHGYPDAATTGAVGAAALAGGAAGAAATRSHRYSQVSAPSGIQRGPSNASSAYSGVARSEASSDVPDMPRPYYEQEIPYNVYNDMQPGQTPYGDGAYPQSEEPVIRDVSARRNTRIERAPTFPQQGGIAQNF